MRLLHSVRNDIIKNITELLINTTLFPFLFFFFFVILILFYSLLRPIFYPSLQ